MLTSVKQRALSFGCSTLASPGRRGLDGSTEVAASTALSNGRPHKTRASRPRHSETRNLSLPKSLGSFYSSGNRKPLFHFDHACRARFGQRARKNAAVVFGIPRNRARGNSILVFQAATGQALIRKKRTDHYKSLSRTLSASISGAVRFLFFPLLIKLPYQSITVTTLSHVCLNSVPGDSFPRGPRYRALKIKRTRRNSRDNCYQRIP